MVAHVQTVSFMGIEAQPVDVQVQISSGLPAFQIVGLPDKAVAESRERVRAAFTAMGLALPPKRIIVNLSPADLPKIGSHFDLPIALGLLHAMNILPEDFLADFVALGELSLDAKIQSVIGILPAAIFAMERELGLICPKENGNEARWVGGLNVLAAPDLIALLNHVKGTQLLSMPQLTFEPQNESVPDLADIKGQLSAKRALEIAAAGGHNMLMIGPPGSGKSMLAARLPGILPPLSAREALDVTMIASMAGALLDGKISKVRPFRAPHHSASMPSLVGGGSRAKPGEISLAHNGVLFLDELPEFSRPTLEALRQPLETGKVAIARAEAHVTYPARVQLIAAMNPCRCGHLDDAALACTRAPKCAADYQGKISGPLFDRIDLHVDVPALPARDLTSNRDAEPSAIVANRVVRAREMQLIRYKAWESQRVFTNATADGRILEQCVPLDDACRDILADATDKMRLSARGYHRVLRVARTIADLAAVDKIARHHIAEALSFRRIAP